MQYLTSDDVSLPKYETRKVVEAVQIEAIGLVEDDESLVLIVPRVLNFKPFTVPKACVEKHQPEPGWYFVRYKDGYQSFSPAEPFEESARFLCEGSHELNQGFLK